MSFLLWIDESADEAIDLGDPFDLFKIFAEISPLAPEGYDELLSVPGFGEQEVQPEWLALVREQATALLKTEPDLSENAIWVLQTLATAMNKHPTVKPSPFEKNRNS